MKVLMATAGSVLLVAAGALFGGAAQAQGIKVMDYFTEGVQSEDHQALLDQWKPEGPVILAVVPFLTPQWIAFEQGRANATGWTGYTTEQLRTATDAVTACPRISLRRVGPSSTPALKICSEGRGE